jgi:hypothetical protein
MCELKSSVIHVDHAARVFKEACEDFSFLKDRVKNQLVFESYVQVGPCCRDTACQEFNSSAASSECSA